MASELIVLAFVLVLFIFVTMYLKPENDDSATAEPVKAPNPTAVTQDAPTPQEATRDSPVAVEPPTQPQEAALAPAAVETSAPVYIPFAESHAPLDPRSPKSDYHESAAAPEQITLPTVEPFDYQTLAVEPFELAADPSPAAEDANDSDSKIRLPPVQLFDYQSLSSRPEIDKDVVAALVKGLLEYTPGQREKALKKLDDRMLDGDEKVTFEFMQEVERRLHEAAPSPAAESPQSEADEAEFEDDAAALRALPSDVKENWRSFMFNQYIEQLADHQIAIANEVESSVSVDDTITKIMEIYENISKEEINELVNKNIKEKGPGAFLPYIPEAPEVENVSPADSLSFLDEPLSEASSEAKSTAKSQTPDVPPAKPKMSDEENAHAVSEKFVDTESIGDASEKSDVFWDTQSSYDDTRSEISSSDFMDALQPDEVIQDFKLPVTRVWHLSDSTRNYINEYFTSEDKAEIIKFRKNNSRPIKSQIPSILEKFDDEMPAQSMLGMVDVKPPQKVMDIWGLIPMGISEHPFTKEDHQKAKSELYEKVGQECMKTSLEECSQVHNQIQRIFLEIIPQIAGKNFIFTSEEVLIYLYMLASLPKEKIKENNLKLRNQIKEDDYFISVPSRLLYSDHFNIYDKYNYVFALEGLNLKLMQRRRHRAHLVAAR